MTATNNVIIIIKSLCITGPTDTTSPGRCILVSSQTLQVMLELEWEYRDGIKSKGDKIMTACTHSTMIEDARKFRAQKKQCHKPYIVAETHS